jgi:TRAP-type mannitol/chloroaromatic compound transport system permease large subunit
LFAALEDIVSGKVKYLNSENVVERLARVSSLILELVLANSYRLALLQYLNGKMTGLETYITEYPIRFVAWLVAGMLIIFFVIFKLVGNDASNIERGEYVRVNKSSRLD